MSTNKANAEKNLNDFLAVHGREGLLQLFLTNYLFELVMYYLHSEKNKPIVKEDTGYRFYVDGRDRVYSPEKIEDFKRELRAECEKKALVIVDSVKKKHLLEKLDQDIVREPRIAQLIAKAFEGLVGSQR